MKTPEIKLRPVEPLDLDLLYLMENDPDNWLVSGTSTPFSKNTLKNYLLSVQDIYQDKQLRLVIENNLEQPVGIIDLFDYDPKNNRAGIGLLINREFRKHGYGKQAVLEIINYCFETLFLHQVYCNIMESNVVSIHLFESLGFVRCGLKKDWIKTSLGWKNVLIYQLINNNN